MSDLIARLHDEAGNHEDSGVAQLLREAATTITNMRGCVQHGCAVLDHGRPCMERHDPNAALREIRSALIARRSGYIDEARSHNKTSLRTDAQLEMIAGQALPPGRNDLGD